MQKIPVVDVTHAESLEDEAAQKLAVFADGKLRANEIIDRQDSFLMVSITSPDEDQRRSMDAVLVAEDGESLAPLVVHAVTLLGIQVLGDVVKTLPAATGRLMILMAGMEHLNKYVQQSMNPPQTPASDAAGSTATH